MGQEVTSISFHASRETSRCTLTFKKKYVLIYELPGAASNRCTNGEAPQREGELPKECD